MNRFNSTRSLPRLLFGFMVVSYLLLSILIAAPAMAHVDLEASTPADGTSVSNAPEAIELRFTSEAVPAGEGIVVATADGDPIEVTITQPEPTVVVVVPVETLPNGIYGVLWTMRAGDAHPRTGTITFEVDALGASAPVDEPHAAGSAIDPTGTIDVDGDGEDARTPTAPPSVTPPTTEPGEVPSAADDGPIVTAVELDPVFEVEIAQNPAGARLGTIGRWVAMAGTLVGIGAFAFAATSLVGTRREVVEAGYWVRRAGILVVVGTLVEWVGTSMVLTDSVVGGLAPLALLDAVSGSFGVAVLLRLVGGIAMLGSMAIVATEAAAPIADPASLPGRVGDREQVAVIDPAVPQYRLDVHRERAAIVGIALVTASYVFDGHTVTTAPTVLVRAASATHVLAAGVWVGGVLLLAWTLASRHRRGADLGAAGLVIRFSRVASVALVLVAVAGTAMAIAILDTPSELVTTSWGRVLIVKLIAVAAAGAIGAYNHFVTVPALESDPGDTGAEDRLRRLVRVEGFILLVVVAVTAILVGAAS